MAGWIIARITAAAVAVLAVILFRVDRSSARQAMERQLADYVEAWLRERETTA